MTSKRAALLVDVVSLAAFVLIGRGRHHHPETLTGFASTVWPFAAGLAAGWVAAALARRDPARVATGAGIAVVTVAVGMLLRVVAGQGTEAAFVVVALAFVGLFFVGGRAVLGAAGRRRARPTARRG